MSFSAVPLHTLTLQGALVGVDAGLACARKSEEKWKVCVTVVDGGGVPLCSQRMDGAMPAAFEISVGKAQSAVNFARETKLLESGVNGGRSALLSAPGAVLMEGGVPLYDKHGRIYAAVGVSGVKPNQDQEIAKAAEAAIQAEYERMLAGGSKL